MSTSSRSREPYRIPRAPIEWRRVFAWIVCGLGLAIFVVSFIASSAGVVALPFDHHHVFGQVGGFLLAVGGLSTATRRG